jgi:hypothetical protein
MGLVEIVAVNGFWHHAMYSSPSLRLKRDSLARLGCDIMRPLSSLLQCKPIEKGLPGVRGLLGALVAGDRRDGAHGEMPRRTASAT